MILTVRHCLPLVAPFALLLAACNEIELGSLAEPSEEPVSSSLMVQVSGTGRVSGLPDGLECSSECTVPIEQGTSVTLSADPAEGHRFDQWNGDCLGTNPSCELFLTDTASAIATFEALPDDSASNTGLPWSTSFENTMDGDFNGWMRDTTGMRLRDRDDAFEGDTVLEIPLVENSLNDNYLEQMFGDHPRVELEPTREVWWLGRVLWEGDDTLWPDTQSHKIAIFNFEDQAGDRRRQVYVWVAPDGTYRVDRANIDTWDINEIPANVAAESPSARFGEWDELKLRVVANTPGQADGIVEFWVNGELIASHDNLNLRDDTAFTPNQLVVTTYSNPSGGSGSVYYDDWQLSTTDPLEYQNAPTTGETGFFEDFEDSNGLQYGFSAISPATPFVSDENFYTSTHLPNGAHDGTAAHHFLIYRGQDSVDGDEPRWEGRVGWGLDKGMQSEDWENGDVARIRFRVRFDDNFRWDSPNGQQNKFLVIPSGDYRFLLLNEGNTGQHAWGPYLEGYNPHTDTVYDEAFYSLPEGTFSQDWGTFTMSQGINWPYTDPIPVTYGVWYHVQMFIRTGESGSYEIFVNTNDPDETRRTHHALRDNLNIPLPTPNDWNLNWQLGSYVDSGTIRDQGWRLTDVAIDKVDEFDADWYPEETNTSQ